MNWADACFSANAGRAHFEERVAVVAAEGAEAGKRLRWWSEGSEDGEDASAEPEETAAAAASEEE